MNSLFISEVLSKKPHTSKANVKKSEKEIRSYYDKFNRVLIKEFNKLNSIPRKDSGLLINQVLLLVITIASYLRMSVILL